MLEEGPKGFKAGMNARKYISLKYPVTKPESYKTILYKYLFIIYLYFKNKNSYLLM